MSIFSSAQSAGKKALKKTTKATKTSNFTTWGSGTAPNKTVTKVGNFIRKVVGGAKTVGGAIKRTFSSHKTTPKFGAGYKPTPSQIANAKKSATIPVGGSTISRMTGGTLGGGRNMIAAKGRPIFQARIGEGMTPGQTATAYNIMFPNRVSAVGTSGGGGTTSSNKTILQGDNAISNITGTKPVVGQGIMGISGDGGGLGVSTAPSSAAGITTMGSPSLEGTPTVLGNVDLAKSALAENQTWNDYQLAEKQKYNEALQPLVQKKQSWMEKMLGEKKYQEAFQP